MKLCVVTPFFNESIAVLRRCHQSVKEQSVPCTHIMVSDDSPLNEVSTWDNYHIRLPSAHGDYGSVAKSIGAIEAIAQRADVLCFLDGDNWLLRHHMETCVKKLIEDKADIVVSHRYFCTLKGEAMAMCLTSDADQFADTNCMVFSKNAMDIAMSWYKLPEYAHAICDRVLWHWIKESNLKISHTGQPTVMYRTSYPSIYKTLGIDIPEEVVNLKKNNPIVKALSVHKEATGVDLHFKMKIKRISNDEKKWAESA